MGQCSQGCIKWHSCVCHNNHHNMSFKWITLLAHRDRWGFLIELFCLLLQWVNCALNDKRERDERVAIWMIMGSVSAFVLFFFTFYARKAELADFFFFFCFNGHTVWRIHSWKLLSSTTVLHYRPLTSNVRPSVSFKGTLSTDKSASRFPVPPLLILSAGIQTGTLPDTSLHL